MQEYNPLKSYPYTKKRLLEIDWSSVAYHQWHAMASKHSTAYTDIDNSKDELRVWRTRMVSIVLDWIKMFNPRDILITLEGNHVWRNDLVTEYYKEHAIVYYDKSGYYLKRDNFLYKITKNGDELTVDKMDVVKDIDSLPPTFKKLGDMPDRVQSLMWELYHGKKAILPKYKGTRAGQPWTFYTDKKVWKEYKEKFAKEIQKIIRCHVIGHDNAEGDDVLYVGTSYWKDNYDSIIMITGDSDMNQLLHQPNFKIFNHRKSNFVECENPRDYLELKILQGDSADNIQGMALPGKKTQLGEKGAIALYESASNCYEQSKEEKWDNQYMRNRKLIDLTKVPTHIQREICKLFDNSKPKLGTMEDLYEMEITEKMMDRVNSMKMLGFYGVTPLSVVDENPDKFDESLFAQPKQEVKITTNRSFDSVEDVFGDMPSVNLMDTMGDMF